MGVVWNVIVSPFVLALIGYVGLVTALTLLVQPLRLQMVDIAENMLADEHWDDVERNVINHFLDTSLSFKVGFLIIAGGISSITDNLLRRAWVMPQSRVRLNDDPRYHELLTRYAISVLALNPIATLIIIPLALTDTLIEACMGKPNVRMAIEEPVIRASAAVPSPHQPCLEAA